MKRLTKKRRLKNEKFLRLLVIINCLIILATIITLIKFKNYDNQIQCKKINGHWCINYEVEKMEEL